MRLFSSNRHEKQESWSQAVTQSIWVHFFQFCHRFNTFPQGKNHKSYFPGLSFTQVLSHAWRDLLSLPALSFGQKNPLYFMQ